MLSLATVAVASLPVLGASDGSQSGKGEFVGIHKLTGPAPGSMNKDKFVQQLTQQMHGDPHSRNAAPQFVPRPSTATQAEREMAKQRNAQKKVQMDMESMKAPMDLPGVPAFGQNSVFLGGSIFKKTETGPTFTQRFSTDKSSDEVLSWYRSILSVNPWTLQKDTEKPQGFAAISKDQNMCSVHVLSSYKRGKKFMTQFITTYKMMKQN